MYKSILKELKEQKQTELASAKQVVAIKSVTTGVEIQGAQKDITLYGQH